VRAAGWGGGRWGRTCWGHCPCGGARGGRSTDATQQEGGLSGPLTAARRGIRFFVQLVVAADWLDDDSPSWLVTALSREVLFKSKHCAGVKLTSVFLLLLLFRSGLI